MNFANRHWTLLPHKYLDSLSYFFEQTLPNFSVERISNLYIPNSLVYFMTILATKGAKTMISTLFILLLILTALVSGNLHPADRTTRRPGKGEQMEEGKAFTRNPDRQQRSVDSQGNPKEMLRVFDFSEDVDRKPDSNGEYTSATLEAVPLPESFTICSAVMVEAWTTVFSEADMFTLLSNDGDEWGYTNLYAGNLYTEYYVQLGPVFFTKQTQTVFFPLQWSRVCLSLDSVKSKVVLVADGQLLGEEEYEREEDEKRTTLISLVLGFYPSTFSEYSGRVSELNIFNSALSVERMIAQTTAGGEECGAPGDLVNWEEAEWTLHSQAKVIEVDREWEGPCRRESQVQVFTADFTFHKDCMRHCQKIFDGRSPSVTTREEWESFTQEVDLITRYRSGVLNYLWLSATEGDVDGRLAEPDHWPETELVNNETQKMEAVETVWRDFYSGERLLTNWTKPYFSSKEDTLYGGGYNCIWLYTSNWERSWFEWFCVSYDTSCPCSYSAQPILRWLSLA